MMKTKRGFVFIFFCILIYNAAQASVTVIPDQSIANQFTRHTVTGITKPLPQLPDVTGYPGASYLTIGDIDGDGVKEIICTSGVGIDGDVMTPGDGAVAIFKRNGIGLDSWTQAVINQSFAFANETVLRDMDGDGDKDIMVLDNFILGWYLCGSGGIYWLENLGGDILQPSNWVKHTIYIEPADDGKCPCSPIGMGTCNSRLTSYHRAIFIDLDGDGDEDFVTTKNHMWYWQWKYDTKQYLWMEWFRNEGGANFTGPYQIGNGGGFLFDMADIDDDGDLDIVAPQFFIYKAGFVRFPAGDPRGDSLIWFENPGATVLAANPNTPWNRYVIDNEWTSPNPTGKNNEAIFADIDNDGALEIVVTNHNHQQYSSYSGSPLRYWPAGVYYFEIPANPKTLYPDQWTPITIDKSDPNLNPNNYDAVLADVYGVDRDFEDYNGQGSPGMVRVHDVNGDGFPDLLVPGDGKGKLYYYESSGSTSSNLIFKRAALYADVGCMPGEAKFDDIDGDGDIDVVAAIYDTRAVKDLNLPTTSASIFIFEKHEPPTCNYIPAAFETITAEDGSTWERVNVPGFGTKYNVAVVAMCPYRGSLYALTRNDQTGFELWRTTCNGTWERVFVPQFTQNDFYGWLKPGLLSQPIDKKFNLKQNTWGDMIEFKDKLYVAISSGYQGAQMYGSIGLEIWSFDGEYWLPVVSKSKAVKDASARTGTLTAISSCANNDGTRTAVLTDSNKSWTTNQWAGGVLEVEGTFSDGTKGLRLFNIVSNTGTALTVQENEKADTDEFTICAEHKIGCDPGRPAYNVPAIGVGAKYRIWKGTNASGFGEMWNKSIVDFEIFNDELYATIGLNYEDGTRVWKTSDGINWVPSSPYSFGRFHGYDPNGNPTGFCLVPGMENRNGSPVSSSATKMIKSSVTGTETLFTGGTGSSGCNGRGARVARLDGSNWNLIVDYFVDENTTGTNENGFGDDGTEGGSFAYANFQAWSWANYDGLLFTGIARLSGGARIMYTATGSADDGAWVYAVGGDHPIYPDGFGDVNNIAFNLFPYGGALYAGSLANSQLNDGGPVNGADIWKATGPGTNLTWTRVTGNGFGDNNTVAFEAFTVFNGSLYVAGSNMVPSQVWGEEPAVYSGAKIYRLVVPAQCGNRIIETGEECEADADCQAGEVCSSCQCETIPAQCGNGTIEPGEQCEQDSDCGQGYQCIECQCQEKTLIDLISFEAIPGAGKVTLKWETASEIDNAGFNIYRAEAANGPHVKVNSSLIAAKGSATQGASYGFVDTGVQNRRTYYYMLEDVDNAGTTRMYGPKEATPRLIYIFDTK